MSEENRINSNETEILKEQEENATVTTESLPKYQETTIQIKNNNKSKKIMVAVAIAVSVVVACIVLVINVIIPSNKYNTALNLMQAGSYIEAIKIFEELEDYKDSAALKVQATIKVKIEEAQKLYKSGKKTEAYKYLYEDRVNEEVAKILDQYKKEIIAEYETKIYWEEDDMSDYHWAYSHREDSSLALIYLSQRKDNPSENSIRFATSFIANPNSYSFKPPIHPNKIRIKGENGTVDIDISPNDRNFSSLSDYGYKLNGWKEDIDVEITFEKMKEIIKATGDAKAIAIRAIGSSEHHDYSSDITGFENIVDYIETIYIINGLA